MSTAHTMFTLAVTVASNKGTVVLQDNHTAEGPFVMTCLTNTTTTSLISDNQFGRIQSDLDAFVAAGACTYSVTMTPADPLFTALSTAITPGGSLTSPLQYKGSIAVNTSFPLVAVVESGWMYHITADVTDNAGVTYTNTNVAFLAGDEVVWDGSAWIKTGNALTAPFQFKGNIALAADFPPPAATATTGVKDGYVYRVTSPVVDNDATKTNTSQEFLLGDIIVWRTAAWYVIGNSNQLVDVGAITLAADFPTTTAVKRGYCYRILADVIDNDGTKTNTTQAFLAGDHIMWDGISAWVALGKESAFQTAAATPVVLPASSSVNYVDTTTIAAPSAVALPAATAVMTGRLISILDTAIAGTHNITITPDGTDAIDGVNAPITLISNLEYVTLQCIGLGAWKVVSSNARVVAGTSDGIMTAAQATTLAAITDEHIRATAAALDLKDDADEVEAVLSGSGAKKFIPTMIVVECTTETDGGGGATGDSAIQIGSATGTDDILAATVLTGLVAVGGLYYIPMPAGLSGIVAADASLFVQCTTEDTLATTMLATVQVIGIQV